jgi:hypothetical protein
MPVARNAQSLRSWPPFYDCVRSSPMRYFERSGRGKWPAGARPLGGRGRCSGSPSRLLAGGSRPPSAGRFSRQGRVGPTHRLGQRKPAWFAFEHVQVLSESTFNCAHQSHRSPADRTNDLVRRRNVLTHSSLILHVWINRELRGDNCPVSPSFAAGLFDARRDERLALSRLDAANAVGTRREPLHATAARPLPPSQARWALGHRRPASPSATTLKHWVRFPSCYPRPTAPTVNLCLCASWRDSSFRKD